MGATTPTTNLWQKQKKKLLVTSDFIEKFSPPTQKKNTCLRSLVGIALMISGEW